MAIKGQVPTQSQKDNEDDFYELLRKSFCRNEITKEQLIAALKIIKFSGSVAAQKAKEWAAEGVQYVLESQNAVNARLKKLASLEKTLLKSNLTKKKYDEMIKNKEIKFIFS